MAVVDEHILNILRRLLGGCGQVGEEIAIANRALGHIACQGAIRPEERALGRLIGRPTHTDGGKVGALEPFFHEVIQRTGRIARCQLTGMKQVLALIVLVGQIKAK